MCGEFGDDGRKPELFERENFEGNRPEDPGHRAPLDEDIGAKPGQALDAEGEVQLIFLLELVLLCLRQHAVAELLGLHRIQRRHVQGE